LLGMKQNGKNNQGEDVFDKSMHRVEFLNRFSA